MSKVSVPNITICKTTVTEKVDEIQKELSLPAKKRHLAFLSFAISTLLDIDVEDVPPEDIIEGEGEKQIDYIQIQENASENYVSINIMQAKEESGFSSNTVIKIKNGLDWLFVRPKAEFQKLKNENLRTKIEEIRSLRIKYTMPKMHVAVYYATNGDSALLSDEFKEQEKILRESYQNFGTFTFKCIGAKEYIQIQNERERASSKINYKLPIEFSRSINCMIQYAGKDDQKTKATVCSVKASDLAQLASTVQGDFIFDLNLRPFLGSHGQVNMSIHTTCVHPDHSKLFWFLNNGVTMICDRAVFSEDPDNPLIQLENVQIVNGCQTTVTLREAWRRGVLSENVSLLVKIFQTNNPELVQLITLTTNNQNKITSRDLRANEPVQILIQDRIEDKYGLSYERKTKEFYKNSSIVRRNILPNTKVGQAYLAAVLKKPAIARGYQDQIWNDYYDDIFQRSTIADLVLSHKIYLFCSDMSKRKFRTKIESEVAVYGVFHIARICGKFLTADLWGHEKQLENDDFIRKIDSDKSILENLYEKSFPIVVSIRKKVRRQYPNPALYFKSTSSQDDIERNSR